jgi:hypothetical protein
LDSVRPHHFFIGKLCRILQRNKKTDMKNSNFFAKLFKRNYERYDGVAPINIYLLRALFVLIVIFVNLDTWPTIFTHKGGWDHVRAAAICMWATYAVVSIIGIMRPLLMLPMVLFEIIYKSVWLIIVAYPLWSTNTLAGSPAEEMTKAFLWVILPIIAMPWRYFFNKYIFGRSLPLGH